jgi:hypothetical protein
VERRAQENPVSVGDEGEERIVHRVVGVKQAKIECFLPAQSWTGEYLAEPGTGLFKIGNGQGRVVQGWNMVKPFVVKLMGIVLADAPEPCWGSVRTL